MKNKLKSIIALIFAVIVSANAFAYDFEKDGIYYKKNEDGTTVSVTYENWEDSYSGDVNIPSSVTYYGTTYSVTAIGSWAFSECTGLISITIPNSVTYVRYSAFLGCTGLTNIEIPNSVTFIGESAFNGCTGLTSIEIGDNVSSVGWRAFLGCTSLTSINVSNGNNRYSSVDGIVYSKQQDTILIYPCGKVGFFTIPDNVIYIGSSAFEGCTGLTDITIQDGVTEIGDLAFFGCDNLTNVIIPNSVISIGDQAFEYCSGLTSIEIPNSVETIRYEAFEYCTSLTSIEMPNSVTYIGGRAFVGCEALKKVTLGNKLQKIKGEAFGWCEALDTIVCKGEVPADVEEDAFEGIEKSAVTLVVPCEKKVLYQSATEWKWFNIVEDCGNYKDVVVDTIAYICNGESFNLNGKNLTATGFYKDTISLTDYDSIVNLILIVKEPVKTYMKIKLCDETEFAFAGKTLTNEGTYTETFVGANGCDSIVTLELYFTSDIQEVLQGKSFSVYPNPAKDVITLDLGHLTLDNSETVTIINNNGQVVYKSNIQSQKFNINISDLESGIYYVKVGDITKKLIIE